jgi:hypothetical protein
VDVNGLDIVGYPFSSNPLTSLGPAISHETGSRPTGFSYVYKYLLVPQVE